MNNYKTALVFFSIILSGCNTKAHMQFKNECSKIPENYFDKSLLSSYEKEKTVYIKEDYLLPCTASFLCTLIERGDRWENIEINNEYNSISNYYRDYEFKNCISNYYEIKENKFFNSKGSYCIAAKKQDKINSNVYYSNHTEILYNKNSTKISKIENKVYLNNKLFLSVHDVLYSTPSSIQHCVKKMKLIVLY